MDDFNGINPEENQEEINKIIAKKVEIAKCFKRVFGTPDGKKALEYLKETYVLQSRFDPYEKAEDCYKWGMFREGQASAINHIEDLINYGDKENGR